MTKEHIRKEMRGLSKRLDVLQLDYAALWRQVESLEEFVSAKTVLIYMSLPDEVPTGEFIKRWRSVRRFAIPLVSGDNLLMKEYDQERLVSGYRGILEPAPDSPDILPEDVDFAIIPGQAFDASGNRLGRGKGYYDRLLPALDCFKVGVCQSWRMVPSLPVDPWDIPMDAVCTE